MFLDLCRLCLTSDNLSDIFKDVSQSEQYTVVLSLTAGVQVEPNDGLPQKICRACTDLVNSSLNLRNQSQNSENKLQKLRNKQNITTDELVDDTCVDSNILNNISTCDSLDNSGFPKLQIEVEFDRITEMDRDEDNMGDETLSDTEKPDKTKPKLSRKQKTLVLKSLVEGDISKDGPITCKICKKKVSKWASFRTHAKLHLGFKFVCEFCGKSFVSSTQLNRHCRSFHDMPKVISCQHCEFMAIDNAQLKLHLRRVHTGVRPFCCDTCGASFFSRRCLLQHLESHEETVKVQCPDCPRKFKSRRHLSRHRHKQHTSNKEQVRCVVCARSYGKRYIKAHMSSQHPTQTT